MLTYPFHFPILIWHRLATILYQKEGELDESVFSLEACDFVSIWSSLISWFGKIQLPLSLTFILSITLPLLVADRSLGMYVC
jgi:hypothetical protein